MTENSNISNDNPNNTRLVANKSPYSIFYSENSNTNIQQPMSSDSNSNLSYGQQLAARQQLQRQAQQTSEINNNNVNAQNFQLQKPLHTDDPYIEQSPNHTLSQPQYSNSINQNQTLQSQSQTQPQQRKLVPIFYNQSILNNNQLPAFVPYQANNNINQPIQNNNYPSQNSYQNLQPNYNNSPYTNPQANNQVNNNQITSEEMNTIKNQNTFHYLVSRSYKQILPAPLKSEYQKFKFAGMFMNLSFIIYIAARNLALQQAGVKFTLRKGLRLMLGYLALNMFIEFFNAKLTTKYYSEMFSGLNNNQIELQLQDYKNNIIQLRY